MGLVAYRGRMGWDEARIFAVPVVDAVDENGQRDVGT